jgi:hypothetical protein
MAERRDPYAALAEHSERQLALAREGRILELAELGDEWERLTAGLPERPPAGARAALERANELHAETRLTLLALRETTLGGLRTAARASRAAHGYAQGAPRHLRHVDRSA